MNVRSGHIRFDKRVKYGDLVPIYTELYHRFLEETNQYPEEESEFVDVVLQKNLKDLKENRKPEGFNRAGNMRMVFPISEQVEFYLYGATRSSEVARVTESMSRLLKKGGLKHEVAWDRMTLYEGRR